MKKSQGRLKDARETIIGVILLIAAVVMMVNRNQGGLENVRGFTLTMLSYLEQPLSTVRVYRQAMRTNTYLKRQNVLLQDEISRLRSLEQQNEILRQLLGYQTSSTHPLLAVTIVAKELNSLSNHLSIDAGRASGVGTGMPLVDSDGLLGQVTLVGEHFSQILPYKNALFRVSARVQGSRATGMVRWDGQSEDRLLLQYVPQTIPVQVGQVVETSGYSLQFPAGIPIGEIIRVEPQPSRDTWSIELRPYASLNRVAEAFVIQYEPSSDLVNLEERGVQTP